MFNIVLPLISLSLSQPLAYAQSSEPLPPVANDDTYSVEEDTPLTVTTPGILANDSNANDGVLVAILNAGPGNGALILQPDGSFTYIPHSDFNGTDHFTYTTRDGELHSELATVTITVTPVNDVPVVSDDTASTAEDTNVTISVLANDVDVDGDLLNILTVTQGLGGTITIEPSGGEIAYAPDVDFHGSDYFTYTASDAHGGQATGTVTINVSPLNDPPTDTHATIATLEDQRSPGVTPYVTDVDLVTDPQREQHTFIITTQPQYGEAAVVSAIEVGQVRLAWQSVSSPELAGYRIYYGQTSGSYDVSVDVGNQTTYTLSGLREGQTYFFAVKAYDRFGRQSPFSEEISYLLPTEGQLTYTPTNPDFYGSDTFTYIAVDSAGESVTGIAQVSVTPVNDAPVVIDDMVITSEDLGITIVVLANDTDVDGDALQLSSFTPAANGTVVENGDGTFTYTPLANFHGTDRFTYLISDGNGATAAGSVIVTVESVNDIPVAKHDATATAVGMPIDIDLLANDVDVDGDQLTVASITLASNGLVLSTDNGTVRYTPGPGFWGVDHFTYTVRDDHGGIAVGTVTVTVGYAPVAVEDSETTAEDTPIDIAVLTNDIDPEGGGLQVTDHTPATHGTLTSTGNGTFSYTPNADFTGNDSFTYTVIDQDGLSATGTVSLTVTPVNDAPVINDMDVITRANIPVTITLHGHDIDADPLTFSIVTAPLHGVLSGTPPDVTYTPDDDFSGYDSFIASANDGVAESVPATITIITATVEFQNGGFEQGNFVNWATQGDARIETAIFGSPPTEGLSQALLSTAGQAESSDDQPGNAAAIPDLVAFLGLPPDSLDELSTATATEGSAIKRTFTARAGDTVTFDWNFFTNEDTNLDEPVSTPSYERNDLALVSILIEDVSTGHLLLSDSFWTFVLSSSDLYAETGFDTFSYTLPFTGTYTLGIALADVGDKTGLSSLLVDNVVLTPYFP